MYKPKGKNWNQKEEIESKKPGWTKTLGSMYTLYKHQIVKKKKKLKKGLIWGWLKQGLPNTLDNNDMDHGNEDTGAKVF